MKVLEITHDYPYAPLYRLLFNELQFSNQIEVVVPLQGTTKPINFTDEILPLYCLREGHFAFWRNQRPRYEALLKSVSPNSIDISHAHFLFNDGELAYRLKKKYGIPYVVTVRNSCLNSLSKRYRLDIYLYGLRILLNAAAIVFISPMYKQQVIEYQVPKYIKELIEEKSVVIPNGIDKYWLQNIWYNRPSLNPRYIKILTVGTVDRNKNHRMVVKALEILSRKGFNIEYRIIGQIIDSSIYEELIKTPFVKHFDKMPKEELIKQYRNADIFILTSITETFGLVYAEAMTQGLPVIYSKGQGFDGQFKEGDAGYHVDSSSPIEICKGIEKVLDNYDDISLKVPILAEKFDWVQIAKKYNALYSDIIE